MDWVRPTGPNGVEAPALSRGSQMSTSSTWRSESTRKAIIRNYLLVSALGLYGQIEVDNRSLQGTGSATRRWRPSDAWRPDPAHLAVPCRRSFCPPGTCHRSTSALGRSGSTASLALPSRRRRGRRRRRVFAPCVALEDKLSVPVQLTVVTPVEWDQQSTGSVRKVCSRLRHEVFSTPRPANVSMSTRSGSTMTA